MTREKSEGVPNFNEFFKNRVPPYIAMCTRRHLTGGGGGVK